MYERFVQSGENISQELKLDENDILRVRSALDFLSQIDFTPTPEQNANGSGPLLGLTNERVAALKQTVDNSDIDSLPNPDYYGMTAALLEYQLHLSNIMIKSGLSNEYQTTVKPSMERTRAKLNIRYGFDNVNTRYYLDALIND